MLLTLWHLLERLHGLVLMYARHPGPPGTLLSAPPAERSAPPWDMRNVLSDERRKVLQGVCIAFSRCGAQCTGRGAPWGSTSARACMAHAGAALAF
jgi:hypothetical protein